jgi:hypothetical protein
MLLFFLFTWTQIELPTCRILDDTALDSQVALRAIGVSDRSEGEARARSISQASNCIEVECRARKFDYAANIATSVPHCWNDGHGTWTCLIGADGWCGQGSYSDD